ncbi:hypothetical protein [Streptosporangium sp. NPDC048865]|uniref:hypothetical protein n=1 Tax=Streptosporangium sp. NPDC048865 TaxID=3155766 RepID=UPI00343770BD
MSLKNVKEVNPSVAAADATVSAITADIAEPAFAPVSAASNGQPCARPPVRHPDRLAHGPGIEHAGRKAVGMRTPDQGLSTQGLSTRGQNGKSSACLDRGFRRVTGTPGGPAGGAVE